MSAARYWKVAGILPHGRGDLEITAAYLHGVEGRVDGSASLTATLAATDGDVGGLLGTSLAAVRFAMADVASPGFALVWDCGAAVEVFAVQWGGSSNAQEFVSRFDLYASDDGVTWVHVMTLGSCIYPGEGELSVVDPQAHFYPELDLLLHTDALVDSSPNPKSLTASGGVAIQEGMGRFGGAIVSPGLSSSFVAVGGAFPIGVKDFSIECFLWLEANGNGADRNILVMPTVGGLSFGLVGGRLQVGITNVEYTVASPGMVPVGRHVHVAATRASGVVRLFIDGELVATSTRGYNYAVTSPLYLLGSTVSAQNLNGRISELRFTTSRAIYTESFAVPTQPHHSANVVEAMPVRGGSSAAAAVSIGEPAEFSSSESLPCELDMQDGGVGRIWGDVELYQQSGNIPLRRRVRLHDQKTGRMVRETWSASDGGYVFDNIKVGPEYFTMALDHEGLQAAVAADRLVAEVPQ